MRVGLVLGAGGVIGLAYHAAALAAIEHDLEWDPRSAEVVVGTSAGSLIGALLRRGVLPSDLAAVTVGATTRSCPAGVAAALRDRPAFPAVRLGSFLARPRLPSASLVAAWARRPWRLDPVGALASVLPDGSLDLAAHASAIERVLGPDWPDQDLWLCTVRHADLRRTVMGRDDHAPLSRAVCASCAVPGYFRPVPIDGSSYIDGGIRSPTNADVLRRRDLDLVIIVSPMSGRELGLVGVGNLVRRLARRQVEGERERLRRAGIPAVLVEPGPEVIDAMGPDFMSDAHLSDIVRTAFLDTGDQLRAPITRTLLAGLNGRARGGGAPGRGACPATPRHSPPAAPAEVAGGDGRVAERRRRREEHR